MHVSNGNRMEVVPKNLWLHMACLSSDVMFLIMNLYYNKSSVLVQLVGQKNFFAYVLIGYAQGMYYLSYHTTPNWQKKYGVVCPTIM